MSERIARSDWPRVNLPQGLMDRRAELSERRAMFEVSDAPALERDENGDVLLYGELDPFWGIDAYKWVPEFKAIDDAEITIRVDSPGGFVSDGILIYNAIADHPADVTVVVDSKAASAASFLAMAADRIVMNRGAELMIHKASMVAWGRSAEMRDYADLLDATDTVIAEIYAARTGTGSVESWLKEMDKDRYYQAAEAVEAGLADEVVPFKEKSKSTAVARAVAVGEPRAGVVSEVSDAEVTPVEETAVSAAVSDPTRPRSLALAKAALALG